MKTFTVNKFGLVAGSKNPPQLWKGEELAEGVIFANGWVATVWPDASLIGGYRIEWFETIEILLSQHCRDGSTAVYYPPENA